jgi:hypothetical protein
MSCFWGHKWVEIARQNGSLSSKQYAWNNRFIDHISCIYLLQKCSKCGELRVLSKETNGNLREWDYECTVANGIFKGVDTSINTHVTTHKCKVCGSTEIERIKS